MTKYKQIATLPVCSTDKQQTRLRFSIVKYLKNSLELLDLTWCLGPNINLDDIFEAVGSLPKLKYLHYNVHTEVNYQPSTNCSLDKLCQSCERLKKERPGLFIKDGPYFAIAKVDNL